jgi:exportin-2 (importin alpha re-exporter)
MPDQGLCHHFEAEITEILKNYVGVLLAEYKANPKDKWVAKDAAMYIVLALSVKKQTRQAGATVANPYVDLLSFLQSEVLPELKASDVNNLPILKADCLKFVSTFRFLLPADAYPVLLPLVTRHLASEEFVVHTYAAAAIERLLSIKDGGVPKCGKETIKPVLQEMLTGLFSVLEMEESKENSYVMKCIMRVCAVAEETIAPYANIILGKLCAVLGHVAQNPTNPQFNHYLFETLACLVAHLCKLDPSAVNQFETALFPPFQTMLGMETCQEFGPYVFQILSQLLEKRPDVSETYKAVFPSLLSPTLWDNHGNVPAIIRLLTAYLTKAGGPAAVVTPDRLVGLLGIFQKLNASKKLDHHAFALLTTLVETQPMTVLAPYLTEIFKLIFSRLQPQSRTTKYSKGLVVFISFFMHTHGLAALLTAMDQIQPKIFSMILDKVWPAGTAAVTGDEERITVVAGLTRAIFASPELLEAPYMTSLPGVLSGLVALVEEQQGEGESGEEDLLDVSDKGFSTAMARLAYAPEPVKESVATPGGTSAKELFIRNFSSAMSHHREKFQGLIGQLDQEKRNILSAYLSQPVTVG